MEVESGGEAAAAPAPKVAITHAKAIPALNTRRTFTREVFHASSGVEMLQG
jgi:hypothetical protein